MLLPLREMANRALEKADFTSSVHTKQLNKALDWINVRYDRIIRSYPWDNIIRNYTFTLIASQSDYALQRDVDEIIKIFDITNGRDIEEISESEYQKFLAPLLDVTGNETVENPEGYRRTKILSSKELMTTADTVEVVSSNVNDDTPNAIRVCGEVSGVELCENIVLTGTTPATSINSYDSGASLRVSVYTTDGTDKDVVGNITIRESITPANVKAVISPQDFAAQYQWIAFFPEPPTSSLPTVRVTYRRRINRLDNLMDIPIIDCCNELIQGAYSDLLKNDGDPRATQEETKFESMVFELQKRYGTNPNFNTQFKEKKSNIKRRRGFLGTVPYSGVV